MNELDWLNFLKDMPLHGVLALLVVVLYRKLVKVEKQLAECLSQNQNRLTENASILPVERPRNK